MMRRSRGPEVKADPVFSLSLLHTLPFKNLMTNYSGPKRKISTVTDTDMPTC